jgi:hypothetical protein
VCRGIDLRRTVTFCITLGIMRSNDMRAIFSMHAPHVSEVRALNVSAPALYVPARAVAFGRKSADICKYFSSRDFGTHMHHFRPQACRDTGWSMGSYLMTPPLRSRNENARNRLERNVARCLI